MAGITVEQYVAHVEAARTLLDAGDGASAQIIVSTTVAKQENVDAMVQHLFIPGDTRIPLFADTPMRCHDMIDGQLWDSGVAELTTLLTLIDEVQNT